MDRFGHAIAVLPLPSVGQVRCSCSSSPPPPTAAVQGSQLAVVRCGSSLPVMGSADGWRMNEAPRATQDDRDLGTRELAYFFIPLADQLDLPSGQCIPFRAGPPSDTEDRSLLASVDNEGHYTFMRVSLVVHQVASSRPIPGFLESFEAAAGAFPAMQGESGTATAPPGLPTTQTVVEAMVVLDPRADDPATDAFDEAIEHIQDFQRTYYAVTQHPVALVSRASLPFAIPLAVRTVQPGEDAPEWPTDLSMFLVNMNVPYPRPVPDGVELATTIDGLFSDSRLDGGPFGAMADLRREALLSVRSGNTISGAVLLGAASELLLRETFLMLMWDEGVDPAEAASATPADLSITKLSRREFHPRLGGAWNGRPGSAVGAWFQDVRGLRNKVVHSGYAPSSCELEKSMTAAAELESFLAERLALNVATYPCTAIMYLGDAGIESRGASARLERALASAPIPTSISDAFRRWRYEVDRHRDKGPFSGEVSSATPTLVRYLNGEVRWWLVDETTRLACRCESLPITEPIAGLLEAYDNMAEDLHEAISIAVRTDSPPRPTETPAQWLPSMEVIPPGAVGRFASVRIPPD